MQDIGFWGFFLLEIFGAFLSLLIGYSAEQIYQMELSLEKKRPWLIPALSLLVWPLGWLGYRMQYGKLPDSKPGNDRPFFFYILGFIAVLQLLMYIPPAPIGSGILRWANPILAIVAVGTIIGIWKRKRWVFMCFTLLFPFTCLSFGQTIQTRRFPGPNGTLIGTSAALAYFLVFGVFFLLYYRRNSSAAFLDS